MNDPEPELKFRAVMGVKWGSASHGVRMGLHLLSTLVFARLLAPSDFGLVGMAMVAVGFVTLFKDLGTGAALVQKESLDDETLSSVFWANLLFGILGCLALVLAAPAVAAFYGEPRLLSVLRILACSLLVAGPGVVPLSLLQRRLQFGLLARIEMTALLCGAAAGIAAAVAGLGVWSLVIHLLVVEALTSIFAIARARFRPRPVLRLGALRSLARFSLNMSGSQVVGWLTRNVDQLLIGYALGATQLGYYTLAVRLVLNPLRGALGVVGRVMFPVLSRIQKDPARFRNAYLRTANALAMVLFPGLAGLCLVSGPLVELLFGARWLPAAPVVALFAIVALFQTLGGTVGPIYQATGRTDLMLRWGLVGGGLIVLSYWIGLRWGLVGVAGAYTIASVALAYPSLWIPFRLVGLRVGTLVRAVGRPAFATLLMVCAALPVERLTADAGPGQRVGAVVLVGVVAYLLASLFVNGERTREVAALLARRSARA